MESSQMNELPQDVIFQIFSSLPLRQIALCRTVCKFFYHTLTAPPFLDLLDYPLPLLAFRPSHHSYSSHVHSCRLSSSPASGLRAYDPSVSRWINFPFSFFPFRYPYPVASAGGLVFLWAESDNPDSSAKYLLACNPLTREFRVLPQLGSAWSRHGSVLVDDNGGVLVLTELVALYLPKFTPFENSTWLTFSSNLPSKPRSPILVRDSVFAICDVGSPWRSQWKLFSCSLSSLDGSGNSRYKSGNCRNGGFSLSSRTRWVCVERKEWGEVMDIMKKPRLVKGSGGNLLMVGGLKSTFGLNPICSTIILLRLNLAKMEWEEAGRMPLVMYRYFAECSKLKVFGGGDKVCFSAKRLGTMALWDESKKGSDLWRWVDQMPSGLGDDLFRGFIFEARLNVSP